MAVFLFVLCIIFLVTTIFSLWLYRNKTNARDNTRSLSPEPEACDFLIKDEHESIIVEGKEIIEIPKTSMQIELNSPKMRKAVHLVADIAKGAASVSNKTIVVVYSPETINGLKEGALTLLKNKDQTKVYADVIAKSSRKVVEKGHIVETGQIRQLGTAGFQILSIVVAQSHLADINKNLDEIKGLLGEIKENLENQDLSSIEGSIEYLRQIALDIGNHIELSESRKNQIEDIVKDFFISQSKLNLDFESLIERVDNLKDTDWFGTGNTYENFKNTIEDIYRLQKRRELLLKLHAALCYVRACIDPTGTTFTNINQKQDKWETLKNQFVEKVQSKSDQLFANVRFNSEETLKQRKMFFSTKSENVILSSDQIEDKHNKELLSLETTLNSFNHNGKTHMALRFDEQEHLVESALLRKNA